MALEFDRLENDNVVLGLDNDDNNVLGLVDDNFLGFLCLDFADLVERLDNLGNTLRLGLGLGFVNNDDNNLGNIFFAAS